jgi:hypothetical protein
MGLEGGLWTHSIRRDLLPAMDCAIFVHRGEHGEFDVLDDLEELLHIFFAFVAGRSHCVTRIDDLEDRYR